MLGIRLDAHNTAKCWTFRASFRPTHTFHSVCISRRLYQMPMPNVTSKKFINVISVFKYFMGFVGNKTVNPEQSSSGQCHYALNFIAFCVGECVRQCSLHAWLCLWCDSLCNKITSNRKFTKIKEIIIFNVLLISPSNNSFSIWYTVLGRPLSSWQSLVNSKWPQFHRHIKCHSMYCPNFDELNKHNGY